MSQFCYTESSQREMIPCNHHILTMPSDTMSLSLRERYDRFKLWDDDENLYADACRFFLVMVLDSQAFFDTQDSLVL